ncbi:hypothetical protein ACF0H5_019401 [Mactra antiquata]
MTNHPVKCWTILLCVVLTSILDCRGFTDFSGKECEPVDEKGCKCKFTDESAEIVDLTSLGNTDNTPRFKDVQGSDGNIYSYNPCTGFDEGTCTNAAMCTKQGDQYEQIGDAGRTQFQYNQEDDTVLAAYVTKSSIITASVVKLKCDKTACDAVLTPEGQSTVGMYNFEFRSICSCPGMCDETGPLNNACPGGSSGQGGSLGVGVFIIIVILGATVLYLVGGVLYMKIVRKETGTNVIPNKTMWTGFFNLIRSGFLFSISKCRGRAYENVG